MQLFTQVLYIIPDNTFHVYNIYHALHDTGSVCSMTMACEILLDVWAGYWYKSGIDWTIIHPNVIILLASNAFCFICIVSLIYWSATHVVDTVQINSRITQIVECSTRRYIHKESWILKQFAACVMVIATSIFIAASTVVSFLLFPSTLYNENTQGQKTTKRKSSKW